MSNDVSMGACAPAPPLGDAAEAVPADDDAANDAAPRDSHCANSGDVVASSAATAVAVQSTAAATATSAENTTRRALWLYEIIDICGMGTGRARDFMAFKILDPNLNYAQHTPDDKRTALLSALAARLYAYFCTPDAAAPTLLETPAKTPLLFGTRVYACAATDSVLVTRVDKTPATLELADVLQCIYVARALFRTHVDFVAVRFAEHDSLLFDYSNPFDVQYPEDRNFFACRVHITNDALSSAVYERATRFERTLRDFEVSLAARSAQPARIHDTARVMAAVYDEPQRVRELRALVAQHMRIDDVWRFAKCEQFATQRQFTEYFIEQVSQRKTRA